MPRRGTLKCTRRGPVYRSQGCRRAARNAGRHQLRDIGRQHCPVPGRPKLCAGPRHQRLKTRHSAAAIGIGCQPASYRAQAIVAHCHRQRQPWRQHPRQHLALHPIRAGADLHLGAAGTLRRAQEKLACPRPKRSTVAALQGHSPGQGLRSALHRQLADGKRVALLHPGQWKQVQQDRRRQLAVERRRRIRHHMHAPHTVQLPPSTVLDIGRGRKHCRRWRLDHIKSDVGQRGHLNLNGWGGSVRCCGRDPDLKLKERLTPVGIQAQLPQLAQVRTVHRLDAVHQRQHLPNKHGGGLARRQASVHNADAAGLHAPHPNVKARKHHTHRRGDNHCRGGAARLQAALRQLHIHIGIACRRHSWARCGCHLPNLSQLRCAAEPRSDRCRPGAHPCAEPLPPGRHPHNALLLPGAQTAGTHRCCVALPQQGAGGPQLGTHCCALRGAGEVRVVHPHMHQGLPLVIVEHGAE